MTITVEKLTVSRNETEHTPLTFEQALDKFEHDIDRLAEAVVPGTTVDFPDWWFVESDITRPVFKAELSKDELPNAELVARYCFLESRRTKVRLRLLNRASDYRPGFLDITEEAYGYALGAEGPYGQILRDELIELLPNPTSALISDLLAGLKHSFGTEDYTSLLGVDDRRYGYALKRLLNQERCLRQMALSDHIRDGEQAEWHKKVLSEAIPWLRTDEVDQYAFPIRHDIIADNTNIATVLEYFDRLGQEKVRLLTERAGIIRFASYSPEQLERMIELFDNPKETARKLRTHDVIVTFVNAVGDHNGALARLPAIVEGNEDSGRQLYFEICKLSDFYRYMGQLSNMGIQPSSIVIGAHGSRSGAVCISDDRPGTIRKTEYVRVATKRLIETCNGSMDAMMDQETENFPIHDITTFERVLDRMRPTRAIDEPDATEGRKKIIFISCHGASDVDVLDIDEITGAILSTGEQVSPAGALAKSIAQSGRGDIDIYGAGAASTVWPVADGIELCSLSIDHLPVTVYSTQSDGSVAKTEAAHVVLRRK